MRIHSTHRAPSPRSAAALTLAGAGAVGLSQLAGRAAESALYQADRLVPPLAPAVSAPGSEWVQSVVAGPGLGILAGAFTGVGVASGAIWGEERVDLSGAPWWKKLAFKPAVDTFNQGISFRREMSVACSHRRSGEAFKAGAGAAFKIGASIGRAAGSVQGGVTGAVLGWQFSGEAAGLVRNLLKGTPLPPLVDELLPLAAGLACAVAGQTVGSAAGGLIGTAIGGGVGGLAGGTYAALNRTSTEGLPIPRIPPAHKSR